MFCLERREIMSGVTHLAVSVAASFMVFQPDTIEEVTLCIGVSSIGGILSDIDVDSSTAKRKTEKVIGVILLLFLVTILVNWKFHFGIEKFFLENIAFLRLLLGFAGLIAICMYGMEQPHRTFMHSISAVILTAGACWLLSPKLVPYMILSMSTHIILDLFNKKRVQIFYPLPWKWCFGLCKADGLVSSILLGLSSVAIVMQLYRAIVKMIGLS